LRQSNLLQILYRKLTVSLDTYFQMMALFDSYAGITPITKLNPIIRGWTNYHNSVVSSDAFQTLDHRIWEMLWRWAKRRHPKKSKDWIANKYWNQATTKRWNFRTERNGLLLLSETRICRHIPLKLQMNPFLDIDYFRERQNKLSHRNHHSI